MKNENMWQIFLITFGIFMIYAAPILGDYLLMIMSGLGFITLGVFLIVLRKYNSRRLRK